MRRALVLLVAVALLIAMWFLLTGERTTTVSRTDAGADSSAQPASGRGTGLQADDPAAEALERAAAVAAEESAAPAAAESFLIEGRVIVTTPGWTEAVELWAWIGNSEKATTLVCGADGSFRLALPEAAETAGFRLNPIYRIVQNSGAGAANENYFRVDGARKDVLIQVEVLPHVAFLVLRADNRQPIPRAGCDLLLYRALDDQMMSGTATNDEGIARLPQSQFAGMVRVDFTVNRPPGGSSYTQTFDPAVLLAEPGPHEVLVRLGTLVPFFAHDTLGHPIAGAYVRLGYEGSVPSGADGLGSYRDAVPHAAAVNFYAPGHLETPITVPDPPPALLDVPMRRASTLTVRLTDWHPEITKAYRADLRLLREGPPSALGSREHTVGRVTHGQMRGGRWNGSGGPVAAEVELTFAEDGIAVVDGIYTDWPAEVVVHLAGIPLHTQRLQFGLEGVALEVVAPAHFAPRTAAGRVVDEEGRPVAGASIFFGARSAYYLSSQTDANGRFRYGPLPAEADVPVWTWPVGHLDAQTVWKSGAPEDQEVILVAPRARQVEVQVLREDGRPCVDAAGKRIPFGDWPQVLLSNERKAESETAREDGTDLPPHVWRFFQLPPGFVTFRIQTAEGSAELLHDTNQPEATLILRQP